MNNKVKNFSTIALFLALGLSASPSIFAADETPAPAPKKVRSNKCAFLSNAPDQHVVVKGDTLWGISEKFLEHPWCWPRVWGMNRAEIKNPHWIYPGQIVYFDRAAGRLRLGKPLASGSSGGMPTVRLSPQARGENLAGNAITTIPADAIEPFLSQPLILQKHELDRSPYILETPEGHVNVGLGEKAFVVGDLEDRTDFGVYRPATPLVDPQTKELLGYESVYRGTVKLVRAATEPDEAHTFMVTNSKEEMSVGDRLVPVLHDQPNNYAPHAPSEDVNGHVVSIYGGVAMAGQDQTVSINRGTKHGVDVGTVLRLYHAGGMVADKNQGNKPIKLPDDEYGTLFVYRVFDNVSYGLIMHLHDSAQVGDLVRSPE